MENGPLIIGKYDESGELLLPSNGVLENITVKEGETVNVGALLGSISPTKSSTISPSSDTDEKKYSPPKIDNDEPKKSSIKSVKIKKEKKKPVEPLILEKNDGPKVFDEQPLVLNEEPLVLDTAHTEKVEEKNNNIVNTNSL